LVPDGKHENVPFASAQQVVPAAHDQGFVVHDAGSSSPSLLELQAAPSARVTAKMVDRVHFASIVVLRRLPAELQLDGRCRSSQVASRRCPSTRSARGLVRITSSS
jgi:hypothetical protein